jgi:hypothetical protein
MGPETSLRYPFKVTSGLLYHLWTFDLYSPVRVAFDAGSIQYLANGKGVAYLANMRYNKS